MLSICIHVGMGSVVMITTTIIAPMGISMLLPISAYSKVMLALGLHVDVDMRMGTITSWHGRHGLGANRTQCNCMCFSLLAIASSGMSAMHADMLQPYVHVHVHVQVDWYCIPDVNAYT